MLDREVGDGQGSVVCCDSWGHKELDTTEQLNNIYLFLFYYCLFQFSSVQSLHSASQFHFTMLQVQYVITECFLMVWVSIVKDIEII